jgi:hypothetical protein
MNPIQSNQVFVVAKPVDLKENATHCINVFKQAALQRRQSVDTGWMLSHQAALVGF